MTGPVVVALGDSIARGVGDSLGSPAGFAAHVAHSLDARAFVNLADNGVRVRTLTQAQVPTALMARPDVVLISVGGNDVLRGDFDPGQMRDDLTHGLERLARPGRHILLVSLARIGLFEAFPPSVRRVMGARVDAANAALTDAARGLATVLDGQAILAAVGRRGWHIDRIHPSAHGHRAVATAALASLAPHWSQRRAIPPPPPPPNVALQVAWLTVRGVPWAVRRSRDLLPHITRVVTHELLEERRARVTAGA